MGGAISHAVALTMFECRRRPLWPQTHGMIMVLAALWNTVLRTLLIWTAFQTRMLRTLLVRVALRTRVMCIGLV